MYSSLSFITPVIIFTLVYNIPKFFELSVVFINADQSTNSSVERCVRKVFKETELNDYYYSLSSLSPKEFFENGERIFANITTTKKNISSSTSTSFASSSNKKVSFSVEEIYNEVLENCCNKTTHAIFENNKANNLTCNADYVCDIFISQLIEFSSNIDGEIKNDSSFIDEHVR